VILAGTFLDPRFGLDSMDEQMKNRCKLRMKALIKLEINCTTSTKKNSIDTSSEPRNKTSRTAAQMKQNFIFTQESVVDEYKKDNIDSIINDYVRKASACRETLECPLEFWKINEFIYPEIVIVVLTITHLWLKSLIFRKLKNKFNFFCLGYFEN